MILFAVAISLLLGLNFFRLPIPISVIITILSILFFIKRFRLKALIIIGVMLLGIMTSLSIQFLIKQQEAYIGVVTSYGDNYFILKTGLKSIYVKCKDNTYQFGDIVKVTGKSEELFFQTYESRFDFKEYLLTKGVKYGYEYPDSIQDIFKLPFRIRVIKNKYLSSYDENTRALIDSIVFSQVDYDSEIIRNASKINVIFLFSMSGIYLSLLLRGTATLIFYITKKKAVGDFLSPIVFTPFLMLIFPKVSMVRVTYMYILRLINVYVFKKKFTSLDLNSFGMVSLLLINYTYAYQTGFIVGFMLSFSFTFLGEYFSRFKRKLYPLLIRLAVFIFMIPIASYSNGIFHPFSFVYQIVLTPLNVVFICLTILSIYITPFGFLKYSVFIYDKVLSTFNRIDISLAMGDFGVIFVILFYVLLVYLVYLLENYRRRSVVAVASMIMGLFLLSFIPIKPLIINGVYFINVGQGDSILIQNKGHAVLIDTGGNRSFDMAEEVLIPFFRKNQIYKLDALITTHDDFDHNGAARSLLENFRVDNYLTHKDDFPCSFGDIYLENLNKSSLYEDNEKSLVFNVSLMNKKFLLMGDASIEVEKYLLSNNIDVSCDVLKVGHHGSKTSSSEEFIKKANPKEAIISCGYKNSYHHPNKEVVDRLEKHNIKIRRTDQEGTISYTSLSFIG